MIDLIELREWIREDEEDEERTLSSLISASRMMIKQATGITPDDVVSNPDAAALYELAQKIIINNHYENRGGAGDTPGLISIYVQLEAYKLKQASEVQP
jgi:hypothetical protein